MTAILQERMTGVLAREVTSADGEVVLAAGERVTFLLAADVAVSLNCNGRVLIAGLGEVAGSVLDTVSDD